MTIQVKKWCNPARPEQIRYYISGLMGDVEKTRLKLTKYFNDIGEKSDRYFILTFNQWDYPVT